MDWITTSTILQDLTDFNNRTAWDRFARRFCGPITRFARQLGLSQADAEEAAQETLLAFAEAFRKGQYDRNRGRLSRWLFGIAFRQVQAKKRSVIRRSAQSTHAAGAPIWQDVADETSAVASWDREWEQSLLSMCLERVRQQVEPATMHAFDLVMRDGQSPAKAADILGVPVRSVYNAKYTVLTRLRALKAELEDSV